MKNYWLNRRFKTRLTEAEKAWFAAGFVPYVFMEKQKDKK